MEYSERRALKSSVYAAYVSYVTRIPLGILFSLLLIKCLSRQEYGAYHIILSIDTASVYFTSLGLASVFLRYIPEFLEKRYIAGLVKLTLWAVVLRLFLVVIVLLLAYFLSEHIYGYFSFTPFLQKYFYAVLIFVFFSRVEETLGPMLLGAYLEQVRLAVILTVRCTLRVAVALYALHDETGLKSILFGLIGVEVLTGLVCLGASAQITVKKIRSIPSRTDGVFPLRRIVHYGGYAYLLSTTAVFRDIMVDNFVISHFLDVTQVALYGFAYTILNILSYLNPVRMLKSLIEHVVIRRHVQDDDRGTLEIAHRLTTTVSVLFLVPSLTFVLFFFGDIVELLNRQYESSRNLTCVLASLIFFDAMQYGYGYSLNVLEKMRYRFYANIFSLYNLIADIVLVQFFGLYGVAVATSSASLFTVLYYHYVVTRTLKVRISCYWVGVGKTVVNTAIALLLSRIPTMLNTPHVIASLVIFILSYLALSLVMNPLHNEDRRILAGLLWK